MTPERVAVALEVCERLMKERRPPGARYSGKEERVIALGAWLSRR